MCVSIYRLVFWKGESATFLRRVYVCLLKQLSLVGAAVAPDCFCGWTTAHAVQNNLTDCYAQVPLLLLVPRRCDDASSSGGNECMRTGLSS